MATLKLKKSEGAGKRAITDTNLLLTIQGEGLVNEEGYFLNRVYDLGVNAARTYYSKYAEFTTTVTAIL